MHLKLANEQEFHRAISVNHLLEPLERWLADPEITEICINRPQEVFCERNGNWYFHQQLDLTFIHLKSLAIAIAHFMDANISETNPILSAVLPNGARIQIVYPPACEYETISITIRKPSSHIYSLDDYEKQGYFSHIKKISELLTPEEEELLELKNGNQNMEFLRRAVQLGKVIVISGETGSSKTSLMKALAQEIRKDERLITIEDVHELFLPNHLNHVHLFYPSEANEENHSSLTATTLLKSCLRMRPDRILLAELRGAETFDFINIAASGHSGSITSCHAGSAALTFERLSLMMLQNRQGRTLPYEVIQKLLYLVVDIIVHTHRDPSHGPHITEIWFDPLKKRGKLT